MLRVCSGNLVALSMAAVVMSNNLPAQPVDASAKLQFDAATVKPIQPDNQARAAAMSRLSDMMPVGMISMLDPGRVRIPGWTLCRLIAAAYRVRTDQVFGPAWIQDQYFDIEAKLPEGAKTDQAHEMLQELLAERFGLALHRDTRDLSGFVLTVSKHGPRLEPFFPPAQPALSGTPEEIAAQQKEKLEERLKAIQERMRTAAPRISGRSRSSWNGVTMAELAGHLTSRVGSPVTDETGITGKYNVVIETLRATDDEPEQTVFDAVEKLGLKLSPRKVTAELLVIDRLSKTPAAN